MAMRTSDYNFSIVSCSFTYNEAKRNLITLIQANGTIERSEFLENEAEEHSKNIHASFSYVNITKCDFREKYKRDLEAAVKASNI